MSTLTTWAAVIEALAAEGAPASRRDLGESPADAFGSEEMRRQPDVARNVRRENSLGQIFQELIQSKSFVPGGFIACLVETTSTGLIVTKS
jgi:hypothetical protein